MMCTSDFTFRLVGCVLLLNLFSLHTIAQNYEVYEAKVYPSKEIPNPDLFLQLEHLTQDSLDMEFRDYTPSQDTTLIISKCREVDYINQVKKIFWFWTVDTVKAPVKMTYEWRVYNKNTHRITRVKSYVCATNEEDTYFKDIMKRARSLAKTAKKRLDTYFKSQQ